MPVLRETKDATFTAQDGMQFRASVKKFMELVELPNSHFNHQELLHIKFMVQRMDEISDSFEDFKGHEPLSGMDMRSAEELRRVRRLGLRPDMGVVGTITTPGYNRSRLWDGTTYM